MDSTYIMLLGGGIIILTLWIVAELSGGSHIIMEKITGQRTSVKKEVAKTPAPNNRKFFITRPNGTRITYNGKIDKADGSFILLDEKGYPIEEAKDAQFRITNVKSLLEGNDVLHLAIENSSTYLNYQSQIAAREEYIRQLEAERLKLLKSHAEVNVTIGKKRGEAWKAEFGGRRLYVQKSGSNRQPEFQPQTEGGEEG